MYTCALFAYRRCRCYLCRRYPNIISNSFYGKSKLFLHFMDKIFSVFGAQRDLKDKFIRVNVIVNHESDDFAVFLLSAKVIKSIDFIKLLVNKEIQIIGFDLQFEIG